MRLYVHNYLIMYISCGVVHVFVCTSCLQVYSWLSECGWVFLMANAYIGSDASEAQALIQQHDLFEGEAKVRTTCITLIIHEMLRKTRLVQIMYNT